MSKHLPPLKVGIHKLHKHRFWFCSCYVYAKRHVLLGRWWQQRRQIGRRVDQGKNTWDGPTGDPRGQMVLAPSHQKFPDFPELGLSETIRKHQKPSTHHRKPSHSHGFVSRIRTMVQSWLAVSILRASIAEAGSQCQGRREYLVRSAWETSTWHILTHGLLQMARLCQTKGIKITTKALQVVGKALGEGW